MSSPSSSLSTLRPDLAGSLMEFDFESDRMGFVGYRVLPVIDVQKQSGKYGLIPIEQLLQPRKTERAPGGGYSRGTFEFTDASFATDEHGAEEPVDDREAQMYVDYFDAELVATQRAYSAVLRNAEQRIADAVFNTTTWTGAALTTVVATAWTDAASVPLTNVEAAVKKVFDNSGMWPNALVLTRKRFRDLRNVTQIIDRVKYAGFTDPLAGNITAEALAQAFDLKYVIVAGAAKNSANEGAAATPASIWNDARAMVCRVAETSDIREPCIGRVFHWGEDGSQPGGTVESYRDEKIRSDVVRVRHDVDEKILYVEMGHLLTAV